jgi:hypothetical protein
MATDGDDRQVAFLPFQTGGTLLAGTGLDLYCAPFAGRVARNAASGLIRFT